MAINEEDIKKWRKVAEEFEIKPEETETAKLLIALALQAKVAIPALLNEVERLRATVARLRAPIAESFEEAWAAMEAQGYRYGEDALEQVRFGWELAFERAAELKAGLQKAREALLHWRIVKGEHITRDEALALINSLLDKEI